MNLQIRTLGPFVVQREDRLLHPHDWVTHKTQQLFKILLTHRGHTVLKDQLIEWLWPELTPKNAANSLRVAVAHLRKALEPDLPNGAQSHWIVSRPNGYLLSTENIWLDVEVFLEKIREAVYWREHERPDLALTAYHAAAELYRGDYLEEDRYEDWTLRTREQLCEAFYNLRYDWAELLAEQHRYSEALVLCQHLLRDYPLREEIWQQMMRFYAASGQRDQAMRAYEQCQAVLRRELDADPLPETQKVYEEIVCADLTPSPFPKGKGNLPSRFRGGDRGEVKPSPELQTLHELLAQDSPRMAILTGAGSAEILEVFLGYARERGATVLRAQGDPLKKTLSFSVLLEALHERTPTDGLLPFTIPVRLDDTCPAECEYARLMGGLCADLTAAIGSAKAVLALENLEHVDDATYQVLCHWVLLAPQSDLLIVGTHKENFRNFWASELMEALNGQTIACERNPLAPPSLGEGPGERSLMAVLEWAHGLLAVMRRWRIDPNGWLKLCDYFQQKLFQVSDQTSELSFLWQRSSGSWPEGGAIWALNSYNRVLLAQRGLTDRATATVSTQGVTKTDSQVVPASF